MLLKFGITILLNFELNAEYNEYAGALLKLFVKNSMNIYGKEFCIYNVHSVIHLADEAELFGSLNEVNCFPFENYLSFLKRMLRKSNNSLQQVVNRVSEGKEMKMKSHNKSTHVMGESYRLQGDDRLFFKKLHFENCVFTAKFDEDTDGAIPMAIISSSWVVELGGNLYCYWPNYFKSDLHKDKAIQNHTPLSLEKCSQSPIVVKYSTNDYQKAMGKLQRLENNLESETESEMKKRKHKKKFILNMKMTTHSPSQNQYDIRKSTKDNICPQNSGTPTTKEKSFSSCKGCEENKALLNELLRRMESMREDIKYLMKLATKNENVQVFVEEFPQFEEIEDINKFNEELSDEKVFVNACTKFQLVGGKDMYETTRKILALLISHKLALSMNWSGRNEKGGFKTLTNIIKLIHVSVRKNPLAINATLSDIENVIKVWLRNAADREGGRSKRK
ncbi:hypothetical protein JTB14_024561 [Gonioctena quinquepunctata]|nr:hypothetical protein JTB14_024561 [Gonioctena quinquepunctata]